MSIDEKKGTMALNERVSTVTQELTKKVRDLTRLVEKDQTRITLWVSHQTLTPQAISEALQLDPDFPSNNGEKIMRDGKTYWTFSSQGRVPTNLFEDHLKWMLDQLFGKLPAIRSLQDQGAEFRLEAFTEQFSPITAMVLKTDTIQRLWQLRVPLVFLIHHNEASF